MIGLIPKVRHYRFLGVLSFLIGFSFMFEHYTLFPGSPLWGPVKLAEAVLPMFYGLHTWGFFFMAGGLFTFFAWNMVARLISLLGASFSWGIFGAAALYQAWGLHDPAGSALGILFVAGLFRALQACASIAEDSHTQKFPEAETNKRSRY